MNEITEKLNRLANLQAEIDARHLQFEELRRQVLGPEIMAKLEELDLEEASTIEPLTEAAAGLAAEIKQDVLAAGATVKGEHLMAVWTKGRTSWDGKALEGYAAAHPEVLIFRTIGSPSVSLKAI